MSNYYQNSETRIANPMDFSSLSPQALVNIEAYKEHEMQETAYDLVATQRAITVGRIAMMGYTSLLQDYETYTQMFPYAADDYPSYHDSTILHRIKALVDIPRHGVKAGDVGGWLEYEENLSHDGDAWVSECGKVFDNAKVYGNALVSGLAEIRDNALIYDNAQIYSRAKICGNSQIYGEAQVFGDARVFGSYVQIFDGAIVEGRTSVSGHAMVFGNAKISGHSSIYDYALVYGSAQLYNTWCHDNARVYGEAKLSGGSWDITISGNVHVFGKACISGHVYCYEKAQICGEARIYNNSTIHGNALISEKTRIKEMKFDGTKQIRLKRR